VVQRDALQLLGIRGWRRRAENRDDWRLLMKEARTQNRLWPHIWMEVYKQSSRWTKVFDHPCGKWKDKMAGLRYFLL